ncbi:hypothetical protein, variant [Sphaeroforma arctica JP610]|uniref:C2 domain-containing protein n=1 Tax=Sphaeroforma arctica JP610 TaxID=667725 RepID=A0A0L0G0X1_9EUKA|nr:hypothetical protein, variant [Sphaeroforma arctica JP610]KNC81853.1 hypothetical protein, variant [Sphaeroforma arctica JP610]|eukprot:XP_014155755.1 hypothetical protein, variant [Sphaeroforma arctica JP610]
MLIFCKTEVVRDNLDPIFTTAITANFVFESHQEITFLVLDIDKPDGNLEQQDIIGLATCTLGQIVGCKGEAFQINLKTPKKKKKAGTLSISAEEVVQNNDIVAFQLAARNLNIKDGLFTKSQTFLRISRQRKDGQYDAVHRTGVVKNTANPIWPEFEVSYQTLVNGDEQRILLIECIDLSKDGTEKLLGAALATIKILKEVKHVALMNEKKKKKKDFGMLICDMCEIRSPFTFLEYLRGGMELELMIAIDFTAINGLPTDKNSLHYCGGKLLNEYIQATISVGQILACYDSNQLFPAYGFGARPSPEQAVSHCFPLNGNPQNAQCHGISGVLAQYRHAQQTVGFSGPSQLVQVVQQASTYSEGCTSAEQKYTVLLILTNGVVDDLQNTIDQIVECSTKAMSIVIVGVGSCDFSVMEKLDADTEALIDTKGCKMSRDMVQFVPYRTFRNNPTELAGAALKELPDQVTQYMAMRQIRPNPSPQRTAHPQAQREGNLVKGSSIAASPASDLSIPGTSLEREHAQSAYIPSVSVYAGSPSASSSISNTQIAPKSILKKTHSQQSSQSNAQACTTFAESSPRIGNQSAAVGHNGATRSPSGSFHATPSAPVGILKSPSVQFSRERASQNGGSIRSSSSSILQSKHSGGSNTSSLSAQVSNRILRSPSGGLSATNGGGGQVISPCGTVSSSNNNMNGSQTIQPRSARTPATGLINPTSAPGLQMRPGSLRSTQSQQMARSPQQHPQHMQQQRHLQSGMSQPNVGYANAPMYINGNHTNHGFYGPVSQNNGPSPMRSPSGGFNNQNIMMSSNSQTFPVQMGDTQLNSGHHMQQSSQRSPAKKVTVRQGR